MIGFVCFSAVYPIAPIETIGEHTKLITINNTIFFFNTIHLFMFWYYPPIFNMGFFYITILRLIYKWYYDKVIYNFIAEMKKIYRKCLIFHSYFLGLYFQWYNVIYILSVEAIKILKDNLIYKNDYIF